MLIPGGIMPRARPIKHPRHRRDSDLAKLLIGDTHRACYNSIGIRRADLCADNGLVAKPLPPLVHRWVDIRPILIGPIIVYPNPVRCLNCRCRCDQLGQFCFHERLDLRVLFDLLDRTSKSLRR